MLIRNVRESDYQQVIAVLNDWWGGRQMADMLPKLFFDHFQNTSFIAEVDGDMVGFLIGFISQTRTNEAYVHFVGVHPDYRNRKVAKSFYALFFEKGKEHGCDTVRCVTSPFNTTSIAFHTQIGFQIEQGNAEINGISVATNYDGFGQDRVLFIRKL